MDFWSFLDNNISIIIAGTSAVFSSITGILAILLPLMERNYISKREQKKSLAEKMEEMVFDCLRIIEQETEAMLIEIREKDADPAVTSYTLNRKTSPAVEDKLLILVAFLESHNVKANDFRDNTLKYMRAATTTEFGLSHTLTYTVDQAKSEMSKSAGLIFRRIKEEIYP